MRCFVAIELPEKIREELYGKSSELEKKNLFRGKITEKDNLHLTLKFLGEISGEKIEKVRKRLEKIKVKRFEVSLKEFGVFNENFIKIIWVHLLNCEELQKEIDKKLEEFFAKEERFQSHITIARVKFCDRKKLIEEVKKISLEEEFYVESFELVCSELTESGPIYNVIEKFKLE